MPDQYNQEATEPESGLEKSSPPSSEKYLVNDDPDAEFGGYEERKRLERRLLWKLDLRMSILVIVYILNYVGPCTVYSLRSKSFMSHGLIVELQNR